MMHPRLLNTDLGSRVRGLLMIVAASARMLTLLTQEGRAMPPSIACRNAEGGDSKFLVNPGRSRTLLPEWGDGRRERRARILCTSTFPLGGSTPLGRHSAESCVESMASRRAGGASGSTEGGDRWTLLESSQLMAAIREFRSLVEPRGGFRNLIGGCCSCGIWLSPPTRVSRGDFDFHVSACTVRYGLVCSVVRCEC